MKKIVLVLAVIIGILCINKTEKVIIPKESIRLRVIANSDYSKDQNLKKKIVKNLSTKFVETNNLKNIQETRNYINKKLPEFTEIVDKTIKENNSDKNFKINYGKNYFPRKEYKNVIYEEGEYESVVITIGDWNGKNFWCVLFPPLCMLDEDSNIEYSSLVKEIIDKYF